MIARLTEAQALNVAIWRTLVITRDDDRVEAADSTIWSLLDPNPTDDPEGVTDRYERLADLCAAAGPVEDATVGTRTGRLLDDLVPLLNRHGTPGDVIYRISETIRSHRVPQAV